MITHHCRECGEQVDAEGHCAAHPSAIVDSVSSADDKHMSVTPLDVGFDLRRHGLSLTLPLDVEAVRYVDAAGNERLARGSADQITAELEAAGYRVTRGTP